MKKLVLSISMFLIAARKCLENIPIFVRNKKNNSI